jgi:hypothetical protein
VSAEGTRIEYQEVQSRRENLIPAAGKPRARYSGSTRSTFARHQETPDIKHEIANAFGSN